MLCKVNNDCFNACLDKKADENWQTWFKEIFEVFCLLFRTSIYSYESHTNTGAYSTFLMDEMREGGGVKILVEREGVNRKKMNASKGERTVEVLKFVP